VPLSQEPNWRGESLILHLTVRKKAYSCFQTELWNATSVASRRRGLHFALQQFGPHLVQPEGVHKLAEVVLNVLQRHLCI
jgi:hypothetical protein